MHPYTRWGVWKDEEWYTYRQSFSPNLQHLWTDPFWYSHNVCSMNLQCTIVFHLLLKDITTIQYMVNPKLSQQKFRPCQGKGFTQTIPMIPQHLCVSFKSGSLYWSLGLALIHSKEKTTWNINIGHCKAVWIFLQKYAPTVGINKSINGAFKRQKK